MPVRAQWLVMRRRHSGADANADRLRLVPVKDASFAPSHALT